MRISWDGELDLACADNLRSEVLAAGRESSGDVVLDLRATTFVDSAGLRAILAAHQQLESSGSSLHLVKPPPRVFKVFRITGVDRVLHCVDRPLAQGDVAA